MEARKIDSNYKSIHANLILDRSGEHGGHTTHCAGLDVHKKTVVSTIIIPDGRGGVYKETRTFETFTSDLLAISDWLMSLGVTHLAMESTGKYWKPIYNILENNCFFTKQPQWWLSQIKDLTQLTNNLPYIN